MPTFTWPKRLNRAWQTLTTVMGKKPKGPRRGRVLPRLEELESRLNPTSVAVPPVLDTTPSWDQSSNIAPFGNPDTATYGETFLAPTNTTLGDFSFHIQGPSGVHLSMKGYVFAWSGSLFGGGGGNAVGSALFSSPSSISFDGNENDTFQTVTVETGGTPLQAGQAYVVFLTVSNADDYAASNGTTDWGLIPNLHVAGDGGGGFVYDNNGDNFSILTSGAWSNSDFGDLAFTVDFGQSVSTPPSVTTQPADSTVTAGAPASFTATAGGSPSSVQWLAEAPGATVFSAISGDDVFSGTNRDTLTIGDAAADLSGYQFEAVFTNSVGQEATSDPATLTVASQIAYTAPALTVAAGVNTGTFTFQVEDQNGSAVALPDQVIQLQTSDDTGQFFTTDGAPLNGTVTTGADGSANFVYRDALVGTPTLTLTDANLNFTASSQLTVNAGPANQLVFVVPPGVATAGQPIGPDVMVQVSNPAGPITPGRVTLSIVSGPGDFDPVSTLTLPVDNNGVADFNNLVLDAAGAYVLEAGFTPTTEGATETKPASAGLVVSPGAVTLNLVGVPDNSNAFTVTAGDSVELTGGFGDEGMLPTEALINWGDGSFSTVPAQPQSSPAFTVSHIYTDEGAFPVSVVVTDSEGGVVAVGSLPASVQVEPFPATAVVHVSGDPGQTVSGAVTDPVTGDVIQTTLTLSPGDTGRGGLLAADLTDVVLPPTADVLKDIASFDIRQINLGAGDSALVTFIIPGPVPSGTVPRLLFLDPATGLDEPFLGVSTVTQTMQMGKDVIIIAVLFNGSSTPKLTALNQTVFTVAASTPGPAAVAAVGPAMASAASGPVAAVQAASFQSTSQLTLTLTASQASQASASRSSLSAADGGGDEPINDADADALLRFLLEKMNLLPKLRVPHNAIDAIRMWLNQLGSATPDGAPTDTAAVPAEGRLAALDCVFGEPSAAVVPVGARGVVVPPLAERRATAKSRPGLLGTVPLAGLGLGIARRKKKKQGRDGERGASAP